MIRTFTALPDLPSIRQILNPERGWLSVIVPIARTNLITNPSGETATTGWVDTGALTGVSRTTAQQYHGAYSLTRTVTASASNPGMYFTNATLSLVSGTTYAVSCKFLCLVPNLTFQLGVYSTGGAAVTTYQFKSTGKWQWIWLYHTETSSTQRRFDIREITFPGGAGVAFYVDGAQVEAINAGETVSTYIDGDQTSLLAAGQFPPAYGWTGTRHASTSYRSAQTRDGGQVKNLDLFKFLVTAIAGLGIADPSHIVAQQGYTDGAAYQTSIVPPREFTISGRFNTASDIDLDHMRTAMGQALALDATSPRQPIALLYQKYDGLDPVSDTGKVVASYKSGLGGQWNNRVGEDADVAFQMWFPFIASGEQGGSITTGTSIGAPANSVLFVDRDENGTWSIAESDVGGISDIAYNPIDGNYYVGGNFTTVGGVAATRVAKWDPRTRTFSALSTGCNDTVFAVAVAPNGDVYFGGRFTTSGGVTTNRVTRWDGAAFNALGSGGTKGVDAEVDDIAIAQDGNVYITGLFLNAGGAGANRIVKYDPAANSFSTLGTGLNNAGNALTIGLDGRVYVSGDFTTANGVSATRIAVWNGVTFAAMGSGLSDHAARNGLATARDGSIYAGGLFVTAGGLSANYIARWNGSDWQTLGSGVSGGGSTIVQALAFADDGLLYIGGDFSAASGIPTTDSFAGWNGSSFILPDIDLNGSGTTSIAAIVPSPRGGLVMAVSFAGGLFASRYATVNTLTNDGSSVTYPTFFITGPSSGTSRLYQIRSYTTGEILSFNLAILPGEFITIKMTATGVGIFSSFRGNISHLRIQGSAVTLTLLKGTNKVAVLTTGSTVTVDAVWPKQVQSASDLTY